MRNLPLQALADLAQECTTSAICWLIELQDGVQIRGTDHDLNLTIAPLGSSPENELAGTYYARANISGSNIKSSSDMSVDNMEVESALAAPGGVDITIAQIESGVADKAPVTIFLVNWKDPNAWQVVLRYGYLGEFRRDSDGRLMTEVRGLAQARSQNIGQTYAERCNVMRFGDERCKFPVATITRSGVVASVASRKAFTVTVTPGTAPTWPTQFYGGEILVTSGANNGFNREVKTAAFAAGVVTIELWEALPAALAVGATLTLTPNCDRTLAQCSLYDNVVNMRAYGVFIPGIDALTKGPT